MTKFNNKLKYHTTGVIPALLVGFVFISFSAMFVNAAQDTFERVMPTSYWYEYYSVTPEFPEYNYKDTPRFISDAEFFHPIDMEWNDYLQCERDTGLVKYRTQLWEEFVYPRNELDKGSWAYTEEQMTSKDTSCRICGAMVGTTETGKTKEYNYCSTWFNVIM